MDKFCYLEDRPDAPPCDVQLLSARSELRRALLPALGFNDTHDIVRCIDALIAAHVADYAYKHPQSHSVGMSG